MSTEIVNKTTVPVRISEGSGGVYHLTGFVDPNKTFLLKVDMKSTYRDYLLTTIPENLPVGQSLTYADFEEYSRIEIEEIGSDPVWFGIPIVRVQRVAPSVALPIVNRLTNQHVQIVAENSEQPIADLAPGITFPLSVDPNVTDRYYYLTTGNGEQGRVPRRPTHNTEADITEDSSRQAGLSSRDFTRFSKIEITYACKEFSWRGFSLERASVQGTIGYFIRHYILGKP